MRIFEIQYWAWPEGARIKTEGQFTIAGISKEEVMEACQVRWPEMIITSCKPVIAQYQGRTENGLL